MLALRTSSSETEFQWVLSYFRVRIRELNGRKRIPSEANDISLRKKECSFQDTFIKSETISTIDIFLVGKKEIGVEVEQFARLPRSDST